MLEISHLTKIYPNGFKANDDISISVSRGERIGIIGPNGAGKTTLIRQLFGLVKPTSGTILLDGVDTGPNPGIVPLTIGYVPQMPLSFPGLTVRETVSHMLRLGGRGGTRLARDVESVLDSFSLGSCAGMSGYQLSGGLRKMTLMAIAWASDKKLLVMDEPTSMVDIGRKYRVWDLIRSAADRTILISSHDMNEIQKVCDRVYVLVGGRVVVSGTAADIARSMKVPAEMEFVPLRRDTALDALKRSRASWNSTENIITVSFPELHDAISFAADVEKEAGVEYLKIEAPSFEKAILAFTGEEHHA